MKKVTALVMTGFLLTTLLAACSEGPAEKKGKQVDNAVENVKDTLQDKGPAQKAGEKADELTGS